MAAPANVRRYEIGARSTDVFGRVLCSTRDQHFVVDGPVQNGCPGEAVTPGEIFLAGVATCGVELVQVFAREEELPLRSVRVAVAGEMDLDNPVRPDVRVFNRVRVEFEVEGVAQEQGEYLVERFKGR
jgi:uncharacterized OsmC-like protein